LNPLSQGWFIPRNSKSIFIRASVTQVSDVAHGPLVKYLGGFFSPDSDRSVKPRIFSKKINKSHVRYLKKPTKFKSMDKWPIVFVQENYYTNIIIWTWHMVFW
jgi:hypothetical protein